MSLSNINEPKLFLLKSQQSVSVKHPRHSASTVSTSSQLNTQDIEEIKKQNTLQLSLHFIQKAEATLNKNLTQIKDIGQSIGNSDKLVRIISSMLKIIKNFQMISNLKKFDKLSSELSMTRRVFRLNRKYFLFKQLKTLIYNIFLKKGYTVTKMDIFNLFFNIFLLISDLNDLISYLIQLKVIPNVDNKPFIRRNLNFYFYECIVFLILHCYQYVKLQIQKRKHKQDANHIKRPSEAQLKTKRIMILKYICDALTSHNDYSQKRWSLSSKKTSLIGMISSIVGLKIIWK